MNSTKMSRHALYLPYRLGSLQLKNRIAMAPMTRSRADPVTGAVGDITATYYKQRASAGLLISEGIFGRANGKGYVRTSGLETPEQIESWKKVTAATRAEGGVFFAQLMQCGRISHALVLPKDQPVPLAPSAIKPAKTKIFDGVQFHDLPVPKAMDAQEIQSQIEAYAIATENAVKAGFDGVEFHAASGYLPHQFFSRSSNTRTDEWGGAAKNRVRFTVEALKRMVQVRGADRVGIKISPHMNYNDISETAEECKETYAELVEQLNHLKPAYIHIMTANASAFDALAFLRPLISKDITVIAGAGYDAAKATKALDDKKADMVAFGVSFLANPDLPLRLERGIELNKPVPSKFFSPGPEGYIDYPFVAK